MTKALRPDMEGDALGGVVDLGGGWNDQQSEIDNWGNRIVSLAGSGSRRLADDRLGILLAGSYHDTERGSLFESWRYVEDEGSQLARHRTTDYDVGRKNMGAVGNQTLDWAHEKLGLDWTEVAAAVGADRRTIYRWRRGRSAPSAEHRDRIEDMRELRFLLETMLPDSEARFKWLYASLPLLRGRTPISLIRRGRLNDVVGVLAGLESGAFA